MLMIKKGKSAKVFTVKNTTLKYQPQNTYKYSKIN